MMGRTHALLGANAALALTILIPDLDPELATLCVLAGVLGALLPDVDAPSSLLQNLSLAGVRPFKLAALGARPFGHRGPLHSRLGMVAAAVLSLPLLFYSLSAWLAFVLGYLSHLAADACTRSGIRWRYPRPEKAHLLPPRLRLVTGSPVEDVVFVLAACAAAFLLLRLMLPPVATLSLSPPYSTALPTPFIYP